MSSRDASLHLLPPTTLRVLPCGRRRGSMQDGGHGPGIATAFMPHQHEQPIPSTVPGAHHADLAAGRDASLDRASAGRFAELGPGYAPAGVGAYLFPYICQNPKGARLDPRPWITDARGRRDISSCPSGRIESSREPRVRRGTDPGQIPPTRHGQIIIIILNRNRSRLAMLPLLPLKWDVSAFQPLSLRSKRNALPRRRSVTCATTDDTGESKKLHVPDYHTWLSQENPKLVFRGSQGSQEGRGVANGDGDGQEGHI